MSKQLSNSRRPAPYDPRIELRSMRRAEQEPIKEVVNPKRSGRSIAAFVVGAAVVLTGAVENLTDALVHKAQVCVVAPPASDGYAFASASLAKDALVDQGVWVDTVAEVTPFVINTGDTVCGTKFEGVPILSGLEDALNIGNSDIHGPKKP